MVIIAWTPMEFRAILGPLTGSKFNNDYSQNANFVRFSEWPSEQAGAISQKLIIDADNARSHRIAISASPKFMEEN
jgi:hypothetical protein